MAKLIRESGGFGAEADPSHMIGQIQVLGLEDLQKAEMTLLEATTQILAAADEAGPMVVGGGGGAAGCRRNRRGGRRARVFQGRGPAAGLRARRSPTERDRLIRRGVLPSRPRPLCGSGVRGAHRSTGRLRVAAAVRASTEAVSTPVNPTNTSAAQPDRTAKAPDRYRRVNLLKEAFFITVDLRMDSPVSKKRMRIVHIATKANHLLFSTDDFIDAPYQVRSISNIFHG